MATGKGADCADIFVEQAVYSKILADDKKLKTDLNAERGVGIRVVMEGRTYYAITNSFDSTEIMKVAAYVRDAAGNGMASPRTIDLRTRPSHWPFPFETAPSASETGAKVELVRRAEETAWTTPRAVQATVAYKDHRRDILLASTISDQIVSQTLGLTEMVVVIILEKDGIRESGSKGYSFYAGMDVLQGDYAPEKIAQQAATIAAKVLSARDCPRGDMPVVFAPGDNGILFHESCGHGMEADLVEKGSSFAGMMGQAVASPLVTLIDDGMLPGYPGSFEFDDEGTPSQKTTMIDAGTLVNYLHSSITARKAETFPTGSARRESFHFPPIPRMRNTYILAGPTPPDDIIRNTKQGLYAVEPGGGGQVNVFTGEFITSIKLGYMIENGKVTYPVKGASIIGRGMDALRDIDMVGSDLEIIKSPGRCGKGQEVPVGVGMPTVRVKSLTVGGTGAAYNGGGA